MKLLIVLSALCAVALSDSTDCVDVEAKDTCETSKAAGFCAMPCTTYWAKTNCKKTCGYCDDDAVAAAPAASPFCVGSWAFCGTEHCKSCDQPWCKGTTNAGLDRDGDWDEDLRECPRPMIRRGYKKYPQVWPFADVYLRMCSTKGEKPIITNCGIFDSIHGVKVTEEGVAAPANSAEPPCTGNACPCTDYETDNTCKVTVANGWCTSTCTRWWAQGWCKKSCGYCTEDQDGKPELSNGDRDGKPELSTLPCRDFETEQTCESAVREGWCPWFKVYCMKSCGECTEE